MHYLVDNTGNLTICQVELMRTCYYSKYNTDLIHIQIAHQGLRFRGENNGGGFVYQPSEPIFFHTDKLQIVDKQIFPYYSILSRVF